jgi:hypothetical protein
MSGNIRTKFWRILYILPVILLLTLTLASAAWAGEAEEEPVGVGETSGAGETSAAAVAGPYDDGGDWELGIHGSAGDLTAATAAERAGMSFWLAPASNWTQRYSFAESTAWEEDFKRSALGGTENSYIDSVDLQFYVGHGWPGGFTFFNSSHDDGSLVSNDCYRSWGDRDNEWLALTSCQVLADSNLGNWAACMNGQHLIMGFVTNASAYNNASSTQAYHFGRYIMQNYSMPQAWYKACDVAQRGRVTRTIINELACLNDKPNYGSVCADSNDWDWWYQTHSCGTETAAYVPAEDIRSMPVYQMAPYDLDDAKEDLSKLGPIFSIPVSRTLQTASLAQDDPPFLVSTVNSRTLEVDTSSGIFNYSDLNTLWSAEQAIQAMAVSAASPNYISSDDARQIADAFLRNNNLSGNGAQFYEVISDTISSQIMTPTLTAAALADVTQTEIVWQVIYSRRLPATVVNAAGETAVMDFSVVGPGAKQKVYVPVAGAVSAANILSETQPVGVQGGWRAINQAVNAATGEAIMIDIFTPEQVKELYAVMHEEVALHDLPLDVKSRTVLSHTVAYWEEAAGVSQGEMIPTYELEVEMEERQSGNKVIEYVYIPANQQYMRPLARITSVVSGSVEAGTVVTLTAADASQTLKALGIADFDIVLGSGEPEDYTYDWSVDGQSIGTGRTVEYPLPFSQEARDLSILVELKVTDIASPNQSFSTDSVTLSSQLGLYLPAVTR